MGRVLFIILVLLTDVMAGSGLAGMFKRMGSVANETGMTVYKGQTSSEYIGGSLYVRNKVENIQPAHITLPSFSASCSGIDAFTGAFSIITNLGPIIQNIGASAGAMLVLMAVEEFSPSMKGIMETITDWTQKINQLQLNTCKTGEALAGMIYPRTQRGQQRFCALNGAGFMSDFMQASRDCKNYSTVKEVADKTPDMEDQLGMEYNIAWKALQKTGVLLSKAQQELFMSIAGTFVSRNIGGNKFEQNYYVSKALNPDFLKAFLEGGEAEQYKCDDSDKCLVVSQSSLNISNDDAIIPQIVSALNIMVRKVHIDQPLTEAERAILALTNVPIIAILNVITAWKGGKCPLHISEVAEIIALDLLFQYLEEVVSLIYAGISKLESAQVSESQLTKFRNDIDKLRQLLMLERNKAYKKIEQVQLLTNKIKVIEQQLANSLGDLQSN